MPNFVTPHEEYPKLAAAIGVPRLYFKREDMHPYGSHKGRSIPLMIDEYSKKGVKDFVISSSGNAALAAAMHAAKLNKNFGSSDVKITLDIFVGNHIAPHKFEKLVKLEDEHIRILKKERPLQALSQAVEEGRQSLRQSTDDSALVGYESLAKEIEEIGGVGAVFIGTSSGTTAQALAEYFIRHPRQIDADNKSALIQVHIVQTSSCHAFSDAFEPCNCPDQISIADAIVDKTALRKNTLVALISESGGRGWCASNEEIETAMNLVEKHADLQISPNSALSVVGAMQAAYTGYDIPGTIVCIICGE